jgi:hypothetical protein
VVWRPGDGGEEMAVVVLGGGTVERGEGEWGEVRWRTAGLSLFIGAEGGSGRWLRQKNGRL